MSNQEDTIVEDIYLSAEEISNLIGNSKKFIFKSIKVNRAILEIGKNSECPVSLELIARGQEYYTCCICNYNISATAIYKIREKSLNDIIPCPLCRSSWDLGLKILFINF